MLANDFAAVSVVIPCYRCARTLDRAIASVAAQTQRPAEVILIDDASGDETRELMKRINQRFEAGWIKLVFLDENVGAGSARNAGWAVANQPYIAFLDADDSWHKRKIEIQYGWMQQHPDAAMTGHACMQVSDKLGADSEMNGLVDTPVFYQIGKNRLLFSNRFDTRSVMLRNDISSRFPFGKRYVEDYHLWLEICCNGFKCYRSDFPLAFLYKASYGESGLSSRLWEMEKGELDAYNNMFIQGHIGFIKLYGLFLWSLIRYLKRVVFTFFPCQLVFR